MRYPKIIVPIILLLSPLILKAQVIDNTLSFKNINTDSYFRLNYENDYFSATDIYYTQGINAELVLPALKNFPFSKLLVHPNFSNIHYGLGLEHNAYTPTSISSNSILYGDRPFAACLFLKTFLIATDSVNKQRFSTTLSTGVIGGAAGGEEMQKGIHSWINGINPRGWQFQINNDPILNYQVGYEKQVVSLEHYFSLDVDAMARVGTLSDKAAVGFTTMFGFFDSPFGNTRAAKNNFRIYAYEHPEIDIVGYDATLQGGLFNRPEPYVIPTANIERAVLQNRFGFVVTYKRVYLEYFQSYLSHEFTTGNYHVWGGIQIAFGI